MYEKIKKWYGMKLWSENMVWDAVKKGVLTQQEANEILYEEED